MFGVKLKGYPKPLRILARKVEDDKKNAQLRFKDSNGKVVARFDRNQVAGWWTEPENTTIAERMKRARERFAAKIRKDQPTEPAGS